MNAQVRAAALALAEQDLPVFPCLPDKRPACPRGFKSASTDAEAVHQLWRRHPGPLIGVPTGAASGFDVLDLDPRHGAAAWWRANATRVPDTRVHRTRSGGLHVLFRHAEPVRNTAGKIAGGVDTRGEGGFVIWWPAEGFRVAERPLAPWPGWLLQLQERPKPLPSPARPVTALTPGDAAQRIAVSVLGRLASAAEGQRHYALRKAAFTLGGLLPQLPFGRSEAEQRLLRAIAQAGAVDMANAQKTAAWGLDCGLRCPFPLEDRP